MYDSAGLVGCNGALRSIDSISVIRDDTQFLLISRINLIHNFMYACEVRVCFMVCFVLARTQGDFKVPQNLSMRNSFD